MENNSKISKIWKIIILTFISLVITGFITASQPVTRSIADGQASNDDSNYLIGSDSRGGILNGLPSQFFINLDERFHSLYINDLFPPLTGITSKFGINQVLIMEDPPAYKFPWYDNPWYYKGGPHARGYKPCQLGNNTISSGIDLDKSDGSEVLAMADGIIVQAGWNPNDSCFGFSVTIDHSISCPGCGYQTMYAHLGANPTINPGVVVGSHISQGTVIGLVGNSGCDPAMGGHLHVELLYGMQPMSWDGVLVDGWRIRQITDSENPNIKLNYEGTATFGYEAQQSEMLCGTSATVINGLDGTRRADKYEREWNKLLSTNVPLCGGGINIQYNLNSPHNLCTKPNLGVTPTGYDNIGSVLSRSEINYPWAEMPLENLKYLPYLEQYDTVFINCSQNVQNSPDVATAIQDYVRGGGSIYASDWAYEYIRDAFPGFITFYGENPKIGSPGSVVADIVDSGLAKYINPDYPPNTIELNYNLNIWVVIDGVSANTTVHLRGDIQTSIGQLYDKPLTVSFTPYPESPGKVIYTTFHNEAQQNDIEKKLLEYLVLIPTTSELTKEAKEYIKSFGVYAKETNINTIDIGAISPQFTYNLGKSDTLVFGANWSGGTIGLSIYSPDGSLYDQLLSDSPPVAIVIPEAQTGNWKYQITGINVPYDNYPYVVVVGLPFKSVFLPVIQHKVLEGFNSQFNNSSEGWEMNSGVWTVDDYFYSTSGKPGTWSTTSYIDSYTNFDYQTSLIRTGCQQCSSGVIIRGVPMPFGSENRWKEGYGFYINRNGLFSVFKYTDGNALVIQDWTYSDAIAPNDNWNILRVATVGSDFYFYINGNLVWYGTDSTYTNGKVGIAMYRTAESSGDYLWVDWAILNTNGGNLNSQSLNVDQLEMNKTSNLNIPSDDRLSP